MHDSIGVRGGASADDRSLLAAARLWRVSLGNSRPVRALRMSVTMGLVEGFCMGRFGSVAGSSTGQQNCHAPG